MYVKNISFPAGRGQEWVDPKVSPATPRSAALPHQQQQVLSLLCNHSQAQEEGEEDASTTHYPSEQRAVFNVMLSLGKSSFQSNQ